MDLGVATPRTGPDAWTGNVVRGTISSIRWTTLPDIRNIFRTCPERDRIPFFLDRGVTKLLSTDKTLLNRTKIEGSLTFYNFMFFFRLSGIQNQILLLEVNLEAQDFLDFLLVECHEWNSTSKLCMWKGCIWRLHSNARSILKVHLHSVPCNFFQISRLFPSLKCRLSEYFFGFWNSITRLTIFLILRQLSDSKMFS